MLFYFEHKDGKIRDTHDGADAIIIPPSIRVRGKKDRDMPPGYAGIRRMNGIPAEKVDTFRDNRTVAWMPLLGS